MKYYKLSPSRDDHNAISLLQTGGARYCSINFDLSNISYYYIDSNNQYYIIYKNNTYHRLYHVKHISEGTYGSVDLYSFYSDKNKPPYIVIKTYKTISAMQDEILKANFIYGDDKEGGLQQYFVNGVIAYRIYFDEHYNMLRVKNESIFIMDYYRDNLCNFFKNYMKAKLSKGDDPYALLWFIQTCLTIFKAMNELYIKGLVYLDAKCDNMLVCFDPSNPYNAFAVFADIGSICDYRNMQRVPCGITYCMSDYYYNFNNNNGELMPEQINIGFACIILINLLSAERSDETLSATHHCGLDQKTQTDTLLTACYNTFMRYFDQYTIKPNELLFKRLFSVESRPLYIECINEFDRLRLEIIKYINQS